MIILILVVNYTEKGTISVSCKTFDEPEGLRSPKQTVVEILVADTGCGIEEGKLEKMFREFEQVEFSEPRSNTEAGVSGLTSHENGLLYLRFFFRSWVSGCGTDSRTIRWSAPR
jgi:signal transduction histidine kinase